MWFIYDEESFYVDYLAVPNGSPSKYIVADEYMGEVRGRLRKKLINRWKLLKKEEEMERMRICGDYSLTAPASTDTVTFSTSAGSVNCIDLGDIQSGLNWKSPTPTYSAQYNKKENKMGYPHEMTIDDGTGTQREYLESRVVTIYWTKQDQLKDKFYKNPDKQPKTLDELTQRLADGAYRIRKDLFNGKGELNAFSNAKDAIEWRTKDFDEAGYKAATKELDTQYHKTMDDVRILPPKEGLDALRAFEANA